MMAMETVDLGEVSVQKPEDNAPVSLDQIQIETPEERLLSILKCVHTTATMQIYD
jgi:hypothetical protein